ncbi:MAG: hypothetical protein Q8R20_03415 [Nanoarchaeota archaeon]|nr:hypothetical protein [Nanoarchaeota archaeon]
MKTSKETLLAEKKKIEELLRAYEKELNFGDTDDDSGPHDEEADEAEEAATYLAVKKILAHRLQKIETDLLT